VEQGGALYEAVAQALAAFKSNEWVGQIGRGHTITVRVQQPAIEHHVRILDFEKWLGTNGKSPTRLIGKTLQIGSPKDLRRHLPHEPLMLSTLFVNKLESTPADS
jgi:hypothetical protein